MFGDFALEQVNLLAAFAPQGPQNGIQLARCEAIGVAVNLADKARVIPHGLQDGVAFIGADTETGG